MADATDLKSVGLNGPCRFESGHRHSLPLACGKRPEEKNGASTVAQGKIG